MDTFDQIWLEDLTLVWLDDKIHNEPYYDDIKRKLRTCINHLKTYHDPDECINYISSLAPTSQKIIMIVGLSTGEYIIPLINDLPQLISIYIFSNADQSETIDLKAGFFLSIDQLERQLASDTKRFLKQSSASTLIYDDEKTFRHLTKRNDNVVFMWSRFLIKILLKIRPTKYQARQDILNEIRLKYTNNPRYQDEIDQFEATYESSEAIKWYTRDCFLYRVINQAFRTENIDLMYQYRFFFIDLYNNIQKLHLEQQDTLLKDINIVYRGQCINSDEFNKLYQNIGSLIVMNNFLSTTASREAASMYAGDGEQRPEYQSIIYEIHLDNQLKLSQPFANIREFSIFPDEDEILFTTGTIFRLDSIYPENNRWVAKLSLTDGKLPDMDDLNQFQNERIRGDSTLTSLGLVLLNIGQFQKAEKYFQLELLSKGAPMARINVGQCSNVGEYLRTILYFQDQHDIKNTMYDNPPERIVSGGSPTQQEFLSRLFEKREIEHIGLTYNNLGFVNYSMGKFEKALSYYNRALEFYHKAAKLLHNHPYIADSGSIEVFLPKIMLLRTHNNIGLNYLRMDAYQLADRNFKMAFKWYENSLLYKKNTINSNDLAMLYHNMGDLYSSMLKYDLAIEYFNLTLNILSQAKVCRSNPMIHNTYHNLASVYLMKKDFRLAMASIQKAYDLSLNVLPSTHPDLLSTIDLLETIQLYSSNHDLSDLIDIINKHSLEKYEMIQATERNVCFQRGFAFLMQADYDIALENLLQCIEFGLETTELYIFIAHAYHKKELRSEAISFYEKVIESTSNNDYIEMCYIYMSEIYTFEKAYHNAILLNEKRLYLMINELNHSELAIIYETIANLYRFIDNSKDELISWGKAVHHGLKSNNKILLAEMYLGIGDAYYSNDQFDLSEKYFEQAKFILETPSISSPKDLYLVYNKLGNLYDHGKTNNELAFDYYQKAVDIAVQYLKSTTNGIIADAFYNLALLNYKSMNYLVAIDCCRTAVDFLLSALEKNNNTHNLLQNIYYTMAQVYLANNDNDEAHDTFRKLWITGIYQGHPAYSYLRSQFYNENEDISIASFPN